MSSRPILSPIARNVLDMALRNNGYHIAVEAPEDWPIEWLGADATFAPGRCFVSYADGSRSHAIVTTSLPQVARAFVEEGHAKENGVSLPAGACAAFTVPIDALPGAVRRIFELSRSLPTAPLDRFTEELRVRALPRSTEAERLVVERVGQDIFREALMDLWFGRCAVTGLDQPEMLRASHMKPWGKCESDAERLDPMNGLLLAAHWDAAFDRGLVTFTDDGTPLLSSSLSASARELLARDSWPAVSPAPRLAVLREGHLAYLHYHRKHVWER